MFNDQFSRTTSRIRFDHPELYLQLRKLASKMSFYQFKMTVIYWSCYLDNFEEQCNDYLENEHRQLQIAELFQPHQYESMNPDFELEITTSIFYQKLGKYPETDKIFKILEFEPDPKLNPRLYRIQKTQENLNKIKKTNQLFKSILQVNI